jgi:hypothetical protein
MDDEDDFVNELLEVAMIQEYQTADVLPIFIDDDEEFKLYSDK